MHVCVDGGVVVCVCVSVYTTVCVVNMGVHMCIKCRGLGLKETLFSLTFPAFMFKTGSLPEPELTDLVGSLANEHQGSTSLHQAQFFMWFLGTQESRHACMARTLLTEPLHSLKKF